MKTFFLTALLTLTAASASLASPVFLGQFGVGDGPAWPTNPPVYSALDVAVMQYGGDADDYLISTSRDVVNNMAWYDGWGEPLTQFSPDFKLQTGTGYNDPGGLGTAWSAYVQDHSGPGGYINYVFTNDVPDIAKDGDTDKDDTLVCNVPPAMTPEPSSLALLIPGVFGLLRRRIV